MHILLSSSLYVLLIFLGSVAADQRGTVFITNKCNYKVLMQPTPGAGNNVDKTNRVVAAGDILRHEFMPLASGSWSFTCAPYVKSLPQQASLQPLQFEYTWSLGEDKLWFDMSEVNGNPFRKVIGGVSEPNWQLRSHNNDTCPIHKGYYRCSEDDAWAMQGTCAPNTHLWVDLCTSDPTPEGLAPPALSANAKACSGMDTGSSMMPAPAPATVQAVASSPAASFPAASFPAASSPAASSPAESQHTTARAVPISQNTVPNFTTIVKVVTGTITVVSKSQCCSTAP